MPNLYATPTMLRRAVEDRPKKLSNRYYQNDAYNHWLQIRCCQKNGILKISCFLTENMRLGATLPLYDIYFKKAEEQYLTYSHKKDKWLTASICRLEWSHYWFSLDGVYVSRESNKVLKKYFNSEYKGLDSAIQYQNCLMEKRLELRHKKETEPWDEDLKQTPDLPKDFKKWVDKEAINEQYMFYTYSRNKNKTGYCTYCEKWVSIKNPHYNAEGICPCCKRKIVYKSLGKVGCFFTGNYNAYILQRCKDGLMIREYNVSRFYHRGKPFEPELYISECRRVICDKNAFPQRAYWYGTYKQQYLRWIEGGLARSYYSYYTGKIYPKTLKSLSRTILKPTGLKEFYRYKKIIDPEAYLATYKKRPYIEKFIKAGLNKLTDEFLLGSCGNYDPEIAKSETSLKKLLLINSNELQRLREANSGKAFLTWLQYENFTKKEIPDETINWLCGHEVRPKDYKFISNKMNILQIARYIQKQMQLSNMRYYDTLTSWKDCISMAKSLGIDTNLEIIYKPRDLKKKHDELVAQVHEKDIAVAAGEMLEKFPNLNEVIDSLQGKYAFSDNDYIIVEPTCIEDILIESRSLQHCGDQERYFNRIATRESYILFLRKAKDPEKAYYTLEVEPDGSIRQKRTLYNKQNADIEKAKHFFLKWQLTIKERLDDEDRKLAKQSRILRLQEFKELRENNVIIHGGEKSGTLLVDVLMADLMEAA